MKTLATILSILILSTTLVEAKPYKCSWNKKEKCKFGFYDCKTVYKYTCVKKNGKTWTSPIDYTKKYFFGPLPPKKWIAGE